MFNTQAKENCLCLTKYQLPPIFFYSFTSIILSFVLLYLEKSADSLYTYKLGIPIHILQMSGLHKLSQGTQNGTVMIETTSFCLLGSRY
jgi:hypothetical protein